MAKNEAKLTFTVDVRLEQVGDKEVPDVMVYAFDKTGQFLDSTPLPKGERGQVKLDLPQELVGTTVRVVLGPRHVEEHEEVPIWMDKLMRGGEERKEAPALATVLRRGGYEQRIRLAEEGAGIKMTVFQHDWKYWLFCSCVVRGRLVKRVPLPDGTTEELGVCHACVRIYEVDKIPKIILRLPDRDLFRLRDDLWRILKEPLPRLPKVFPPPGPLPGPLPKSELSELETIFHTESAPRLRNLLIANADLLAVSICSIQWLWYWFKSDLIKCVCTDEQGRFETTIWYPCAGDKPDLYFKAVQCIGGSLHTLYDPGVACHTYWDYECGTEVLLETDDPAAITCVPPDIVEPPPGVTVWVMPHAVGGRRLDQIGATGLTDLDATWTGVPFGGTLGFRLGYSSGIPYGIANRPAFYRWLYNKLDSLGNETEWREFAAPVANTVVRHYVDYDQAHPELPPTFPAYPLGPQEKNNLHVYEFKPHQPPTKPGHNREWPVDDWFADIYAAIMQSTSLPGGVVNAAGEYKIKVEVYDINGDLLTPGAGTFEFIVPTGLGGDGVTILSRDAVPGEMDGAGFVFHLNVDNNPCEAEIYESSVNGVAAGACGFIAYGPKDDVHLSFKAKHPNDHARYRFRTVRGSSGYVNAACAPDPAIVKWAKVTDTPVNGFVRDGSSVFTKDVDEAVIRGGCVKAAFGETLYVQALATNGWIRLSGLDKGAVPKAFALEPETP